MQLPIFPPGVTPITSEIAFQCEEGKVCYFNGHLPVFIHDKKELATFRLFTSQLVINGNATQAQIARAFGVPLVTVKRYVKLYREGGTAAFLHRLRSGSEALVRLESPVRSHCRSVRFMRLSNSCFSSKARKLQNTWPRIVSSRLW